MKIKRRNKILLYATIAVLILVSVLGIYGIPKAISQTMETSDPLPWMMGIISAGMMGEMFCLMGIGTAIYFICTEVRKSKNQSL